MAFTLYIPPQHHEKFAEVANAMEHIQLNADNKSGIVTDIETGGIVSFILQPGGTVEFTVLDAKGKTEDEIKASIQGHAEEIVKAL